MRMPTSATIRIYNIWILEGKNEKKFYIGNYG